MSLSTRRAAAVLALGGGLLISPLSGAAVAAPGPVLAGPARIADAPRLASADNFRDIAGTGAGYPAQGSHRLNKGVIYRSNALTLSDADLATLDGLRPAEVIDMRNDDEIAAAPDRVPAGASYVNIQILAGDLAEQAGKLRSPEEARQLLCSFNREFVTSPDARDGMARTLTRIADQPGPVVFHCTAGKDRTGWATYLLQSIVGVDSDTIMRDYLLTNEYSAASIEATVAHIAATRGPEAAVVIRPLLGVDRSYLEAGITQLTSDYGTVDKYLRDGLGLRPQVVSALRAKLIK
ncbi:tyrosine-protein phosphatase [Nocardia sp. NPDC058633]|uniref:tyrosine-protein phosphatase n=1 Tax=Nocardia sp. NPDC058633 TaxID=3346568 RepID=UPI0036656820